MSKKKPKDSSKQGSARKPALSEASAAASGKPNRKNSALNTYVPPVMREIFNYLAWKARRKLTAEATLAFEEYLTKLGVWPPERIADKELLKFLEDQGVWPVPDPDEDWEPDEDE